MLKLENVNVRYPSGVEAVRNVNLSLEEEKIHGIIGRNIGDGAVFQFPDFLGSTLPESYSVEKFAEFPNPFLL